MVERYGAIKRGEAPARDVEIPKQTNDQTRTRQYVRTAAEASQLRVASLTALLRT